MTTQRLTPAEFAAIRERAEKATPGPWQARRWGVPTSDQHCVQQAQENGKEVATVWRGARYPGMPEISEEEAAYNADFIAHAREDIPRLLDALEASMERESKLVEALLHIQSALDRLSDDAWQFWKQEAGMDGYGAALAYDTAHSLVADTLKELGLEGDAE